MRGMISVVLFTLLTAVCWGVYGPVLHHGAADMGGSTLRPFVCVGLAYFLIAILVPGIVLRMRPERGSWTTTGIIWSLIAGTAGTRGAGRDPGFQVRRQADLRDAAGLRRRPVVNTFYTMVIGRSYKQAGPIFYAG